MILACAKSAVITPSYNPMLVGTLGLATGVHDDLYARVIVIDDGNSRVAIVTLDLIGMSLAMGDKIRSSVYNKTGIRHALLCCSHTHSAPFTIPWSLVGWQDFQMNGGMWYRDMIDKIVKLVSSAQDNLREVTLSAGREKIQVGKNRRLPTRDGISMQPNPDGSVVGWVDVLKIEDTNGSPVAVLYSHAAHPVVIHSSSTLISADYPGYSSAIMQKHLGEDCITLFAQGCGGNVNAPWLGGFNVAENVGSDLGEAVVRAAKDCVRVDGKLNFSTKVISLPLEEMPTLSECDEILQSARMDLATAEKSETAFSSLTWELRDRVLLLEDLRTKVISGEIPELRFEISTLKIGTEWCLTAMTHEIFADYQLWADSASPFTHNMVVAYTNGCESYIPTDADYALGGYEAASCPRRSGVPASMAAMKYPNRLALRPGTEDRIKNALIEAWNSSFTL